MWEHNTVTPMHGQIQTQHSQPIYSQIQRHYSDTSQCQNPDEAESPQPHMIMFLVICKMHSYTKTYLKSSDILSLLLKARLVSDKLAPVSSLQAWNDCLGSTFALSRPVSDWERCKSLRCSSVTQIKTL